MGPGRKICIVLSGTKTTKAVFKRLNSGIVTNSSSRAKQLMTKCDLKKSVFSHEVSVGKTGEDDRFGQDIGEKYIKYP